MAAGQDPARASSLLHVPVTVLGGTGFLGRALCARLEACGAEVTAMSRGAPARSDRWRHVAVDVGDESALAAALRAAKPTILFNLAGLASGRPDRELVLPMLRAHLLSTLNVLSYAADSDCRRVILAASLEEPEDTDPSPQPASPYAAAKWTASTYSRMFHRLYGAPVVLARVFMTYGPGPQNMQKVVPYTALSLLRSQTPSLSSGTRAFDWIFIDDVAGGLVACATAADVEGKVVEIGSGNVATVREVVERIVELIDPSTRPLFGGLPDRPGEIVRRANVDECYALTGWRPTVELADGLERTVQWLRSNSHELP